MGENPNMKIAPVVKHKINGIVIQRYGRGFSVQELNEAGLGTIKAKQAGITIDRLRNTVHKENVDILKSHVKDTVKKNTHSDPQSVKLNSQK
jgi:ribosomal protein L13E